VTVRNYGVSFCFVLPIDEILLFKLSINAS